MFALKSKLLAFSVIVAACVGAIALPASATPVEEASQSANADSWESSATFNVGEHIQLGPGEVIEETDTDLFEIREAANRIPQSIHVKYHPWWSFSAKAAFPIRQAARTTGYWLLTSFSNSGLMVYATCEVFDRDPSMPGAKPVRSSRFKCETQRHGLDNDFAFTVGFADVNAEASGTVRTTGHVSLADGEYTDRDLSTFFVKGDKTVPEDGQTRFSSMLRDGDAGSDSIHMWVGFQYTIVENGTPTPYKMIGWNDSSGETECTVRPVGKYICSTDGQSKSSNRWDATFIVGLDGIRAEASGTVTATDVALQGGTFRTDSGYHKPGADKLASGGSTRFTTVLLEGDDPFYENQARMEWAYQIVDKGAATGFWVAGLSTNHRGTVKFTGDGRCAIYKSNPLLGAGRLDGARAVENSAYTCSATGEVLHGPGENDNRHFDGTFTVTKK